MFISFLFLWITLFLRWRSVCKPAVQERSPLLRQCWRLWLHLQIRIFRSALWNRFKKTRENKIICRWKRHSCQYCLSTCDFQLSHNLWWLFFSFTDQTICVIDKKKGCSQFCKPGYQSYECSCAWGWKLQQKEKCVPAGENCSLFLGDVTCSNVNPIHVTVVSFF